MTFPRRTLRATARFEGKGLHSGEPSTVLVHPGGDGIIVRRGAHRWPAAPEWVTNTERQTTIGEVRTVEHLLAALAGMGITDAEIEALAAETPGMDGCALIFAEGLQRAGIEQRGELTIAFRDETFELEHGDVRLWAGRGRGWWKYEFHTTRSWAPLFAAELHLEPEVFVREVAPARTFCFSEELPLLAGAGLGRGLGPDSAFAIGLEGFEGQVRFADEPSRHKLLDLIGDLSLSGVPVAALDVTAVRSGHAANVAFARQIAAGVTVTRSG
jgi:UDP-3-O-[3-hydroxymyristoyl] N-acetylglucosamine deacetylase